MISIIKLRCRGALFIEQALLLAFVIVVGVFFISDNSFSKSINEIFGKTEIILACDNTKTGDPIKDYKDKIVTHTGFYSYWSNVVSGYEAYTVRVAIGENGMLPLEANAKYVAKLEPLTEAEAELINGVELLLFNDHPEGKNEGDYKVAINTGYKAIDIMNNGVNLKTDDTHVNLAIHVNKRTTATGDTSADRYKYSEEETAAVQKIIVDKLTITPVDK